MRETESRDGEIAFSPGVLERVVFGELTRKMVVVADDFLKDDFRRILSKIQDPYAERNIEFRRAQLRIFLRRIFKRDFIVFEKFHENDEFLVGKRRFDPGDVGGEWVLGLA